MRPPLRWFGSKTKMAPRLVSMLPAHDHYVEVFAGSAAVLFAKPRAKLETLNDLDGDVVNLFAVLRDQSAAADLARLVALTPYSRDEYVTCREAHDDPIERARRFLVISHQAVGNPAASFGHGTSGWSYTIAASAVSAARAHRWTTLPDRLERCAHRLQGVQIENLPWQEMVNRYDAPGVVMFIDPPYEHSTRPNTAGDYRHEMTTEAHEELVEALIGLQRANAVVTHYPHPIYERLTENGWQAIDIASHADNPSARRQDARVERVWSSIATEPTLFADITTYREGGAA